VVTVGQVTRSTAPCRRRLVGSGTPVRGTGLSDRLSPVVAPRCPERPPATLSQPCGLACATEFCTRCTNSSLRFRTAERRGERAHVKSLARPPCVSARTREAAGQHPAHPTPPPTIPTIPTIPLSPFSPPCLGAAATQKHHPNCFCSRFRIRLSASDTRCFTT
jgi:hypothetical protein